MTNSAEELAARAAAAAASESHETTRVAGQHPTPDAVSDALEGLPDEQTAEAVLAHAESCDACAVHVAELESVIELTRYAYPDPMPAAVETRLVAALAVVGQESGAALPSQDAPSVSAPTDRLASLSD